MVGTALNHYRIIKALGSGGMGEVYLAEDTRLKRAVAIKILPAALAAHPDRRERFEREAQAVAALNHQNVVTVYSVEQAGETLFLTMEYVDGRTLADVLPKGGLALKRLLAIARQIVDAVIVAHDRGIVHRDLKPANVMLDANDRVKVLDFGLAKLREAGPSLAASTATRELTGEGTIVGTVAYMSPEQAEGKPVDQRSDIFSLGVLLYEGATGDRPFTGDTSMSVLSSILRDTPKSLTDINPELPRDLARIVRHCLAKDPDRRYQSAKDLRNDLEDLEQPPDSGDAHAAASATRQLRRRWPWIAAAAVAAVVAVAIAAVAWIRRGDQAGAPPPSATHTRLTQTPGSEQFPALSPDGKWVVYARAGDLFLQSVTGQTAINLTNDGAGNQMPAFSPDGELIAFRSNRAGGGLFVMGRTGESVRRVAAAGYHPDWFPNGHRLVFATQGAPFPESIAALSSELRVVGLDGGEPAALVSGYYASGPRVSPRGLRVAYWAMRQDLPGERSNRDIWTVDADGGTPVRVTMHEANDWNPVWAPDGRWIYFLSNRAGSMNLWRIAIDEATGRTTGVPQPLTAPASYVAHFTLSADGRTGAYAAFTGGGNLARIAFDARSGTVNGPVQPVTSGTRDFANYVDVTRDGTLAVTGTTGRQGREDIYVVSVADGGFRQLTDDFARDRSPSWSADGRRVFFYSDRAGDYDVWSVDADGGGLQQLTRGAWRGYPVASRDGSRVAMNDIVQHRLFIYDAADFTRPVDTPPPVPDASVVNPRPQDWSPDGRSLLFWSAGGTGVWRYSIENRSYPRFTDGSGGNWLQDGLRFIYANGGRLHLFDTASNTTREILAMPGENLAAARLAADDSRLFFIHGATESDIWLVRFGDDDKRSTR
jgi:Tol biopolymer transport system component/predicted Ser/Thr protein kinase